MNNIEKKEGINLIGALGETHWGAVGGKMSKLGWSVFPQDRATRRPAMCGEEVIRPQSEHHIHEVAASDELLERWRLYCPGDNVACVFGPRMQGVFALDIDILDRKLSDEVVALATAHLGVTPFIRIGKAPKAALLYRVSGDTPIQSRARALADADGTPSGHAVEILGPGKSLTVWGRHHSTGQMYTWIGNRNPAVHSTDAIPEVASDQVEAFLSALEAAHPAVKSASGWAGAEWGEADAGRVRVSRPHREPGAPLATDGRAEILRELVWRNVRSNGRAFVAAAEGDELRQLCVDVAAGIADAFAKLAVCDSKWAPEALKRTALADVSRMAGKLRRGEIQPPRGQGVVAGLQGQAPVVRPVIKLITGEIEAAVTAAEAALDVSGRSVYQRNDMYVQLGWEPVMSASGREVAAQRIFPVNEHALLEHVSVAAEFVTYKGSKKDADEGSWNRAAPPAWIARTMMSRAGRKQISPLAGVVGAPTLRADGSILQAEGYDPATGLLLDFAGAEFEAIPETPSQEDARAALAVLRDELLSDYPFVTPADRSVALACWLTAVVRKSLRTSPMFLFSAPVRGSGKSKLLDVASVLVTGREAGVISQAPDDDAEDEKRMGSELMKGTPIIVLDNIERPAGGMLLQSLLTQVTVSPRVLGQSKSPELSTNTLVCGTGNNVLVLADMTRRCLLSTIDPQVERPELRSFAFDPVERAKADRGRYVAAALTVLRAYHVAGRPAQGVVALGSFTEWSGWIRSALLWLGEADPCLTQDTLEALDPRRDELASVVLQWKLALGAARLTVRDIVASACEQRPDANGFRQEFVRPDFREALLSVAAVGGNVNARRLARYLGNSAGRLVHGCRIQRDAAGHGGLQTWRLELDEPAKAEFEAADMQRDIEQDRREEAAAAREADVRAYAAVALGDADKAALWMSAAHAGLGGLTPAQACKTETAAAKAEDILRRMPTAIPLARSSNTPLW